MPEEVKQREDIDLDKLLYVIETLKDIAAESVAATDLNISVVRLLRLIMGTFGSTKGGIFLYDEAGGLLHSAAARGPEYKVDLAIRADDAEQLGKNTQAMTHKDFVKAWPILLAGNAEALARTDVQIWLPLGVHSKFVGVIGLGEKFVPGGYADSEVSLLTMIGRQIAVSVNNHQLVTSLNVKNIELRQANQDLDESNRRIDTLYRISLELNEKMQDNNQLLETLMRRAIDQSHAQHGLLLSFDEDQQVLYPETLHNLSLPQNYTIPLDTPLGKALLDGQLAREEGDLEKLYGLPGRHLLGVPMRTRARSLGILCLLDKQEVRNTGAGPFNERDVKLLTSLANQAATTMDNARLYEMATVDGNTRLYVRRYFDQRLLEETKKALRFQKQLSLLMLDIDLFKRFNDTFGHQTGDEVLRMVAHNIKTTIRKDIDIPARYGGEEMTVIMPETELSGAQHVAERIRSTVENSWLPGPNSQRLQVTISIGVANLPAHAATGEDLLKKADVALYRAKEDGRNRVAVYQ